MLQLYDVNHNKICGLVNYKGLNIQREINQIDILSFLYPISDAKHDLIQEECYIRTKDNEYVVKEVNYSDENYDEYVCTVNNEDISGKDVSHFEAIEQTCTDSVNLALSGTGWTIGNCDVTKKRTTRKNNCTAYDVLKEIQSAYSCEMTFDAINKKVYIYQKMGTDKGAYFIEQLNLKKVNPQRNSYDYITRLIAIGKDGLDITSINGGKNYVENYQYSNKILTAFWEDNRYTVAQDLKDDAVERLDFLSKPYKAYSADVYDLANMSEDNKYSILDYSLGDTITLSSKTRNIKEKQRIVKLAEYPDEPEKNTVEIANKIASLDVLNVRFQDTSDTVDSVTTSAGEVDGTKVDGIDWTQVKNVSIYCADIQDLSTVTARIGTLETTTAHITNGIIDNATIDVANVNNLSATYATIQNLSAATANISTLQTDVASIKTVLAGNVGASNLQAGAIQAGSAVIANSAISSAQIISLDVGKINAGDISTTKFRITSDSGNMLMSDNTLQIKDANRTRVQIGKDASNDYNIYVWDASGNLMFDATGLHESGIKQKIIRNDMVSDTANINAAKIDINSLYTQMNGSTQTLKSSKIYLDTQAQTLNVAFDSLSQTVSTQGQTVSSQGTQITTIQGQISNKIWETDITTAVDNVKLGVRNLIPNGDFSQGTVAGSTTAPTNWNFYSNAWVYGSQGQSDYNLPKTLYIGHMTSDSGIFSNRFILKPSTQYTLAFSSSKELVDSVTTRIEYYDSNGSQIDRYVAPYDYSKSNTVQFFTFITPASFANAQVAQSGTAERNDGGYLTTLGNVMLVEGNKAPTDFIAAPEDTQSQITTINSNYSSLNQTVNGISANVSSLQTTTSNLGSRMTTAEANITAQAGQIATKVTQTQVDNSIAGVQIGGTNLLRNTSNFKDLTNWYLSMGSGQTGVIELVTDSIKGSVIHFTKTNDVSWWVLTNSLYNYFPQRFDTTKQYTISFDLKSKNGAALNVAFMDGDGINVVTNMSLGNIPTSWTRMSRTFTPAIAGNNPMLYMTGNMDEYWITNVMLEQASKPSNYSPAPEEMELRMSSAESSITQNANQIALKVSSSDYNGNTIASLINQSATTVAIQASKIDLTGYVTINSLSTAGATVINGSNITTGTIDAHLANIVNINANNINGGTINANLLFYAGSNVAQFLCNPTYQNTYKPAVYQDNVRITVATNLTIAIETVDFSSISGGFYWQTGSYLPAILCTSSYYNCIAALYQIYIQDANTAEWSWQSPNATGLSGYVKQIKVCLVPRATTYFDTNADIRVGVLIAGLLY